MALIDFDKFIASFITEMKECSQMRNFSIPRCIKKALIDQGLEYKDGEIVKTQCKVSAEAKEAGYGESEDEKVINEIINTVKGNHPTHSSKEIQKMVDWLENIPYTIDHEKREGFQLGYKAGLEKQGQKPAEWSEEDEKVLNTTIAFLDEFKTKGYENAVMCVDWLKLFKQRIGG